MACLNDLPDELLFTIFECLPALRQFTPERDFDSQRRLAANQIRRATLSALCQTSKRCKCIAKQHLYSDIVVDDPTTRACQRLDHLLRTIIAKPDLAVLIQYLEYVPQTIELDVEMRSRPHERAIDWVASTIFSAFEASVFSNGLYGEQLAISQVALVLFIAPNITHLACSIRRRKTWMGTPLLLRALGFQSTLFPEHSEFPPLPSLERVCLLSSELDDSPPSDEPKQTISPGEFALKSVTHIPRLKHLAQTGVQYGLQPSCNFALLHTLYLGDNLIPVTRVITAVEQCPNLRTFEYSMASGVHGPTPCFDTAALSQALLQSKDTLETLSLVHDNPQCYDQICPVTSFHDFHKLKTLTISICLLWTQFQDSCIMNVSLPNSIERLNFYLERDANMSGAFSRLDALLWSLIDDISRFPRLRAVNCVDLASTHNGILGWPPTSSKCTDAFAEKKVKFTVESVFNISFVG